MGIFDRFRGKKQESQDEGRLGDAAAAAAVSPSLELADVAPTQSDATAKILSFNQEESGRLYNPYEGGINL